MAFLGIGAVAADFGPDPDWQGGQLGDPPRIATLIRQAIRPRFTRANAVSIPLWVDTSNRSAVRDLYNSVLASSAAATMQWTGDIIAGVPGTTSEAYRAAALARVNWYRSMAGVPAISLFDPVFNSKTQQAALMMSANRQLNHNPPANWVHYTAEGAAAASKSNLCLGFSSDPGCVNMYMEDPGANNAAAGHRRWVLYPQTRLMGTGDVSATGTYPNAYSSANALWVIDSNVGGSRPATREPFVAWPSNGYVPYQVIPARWSFSYPGANFSGSTISMQRDGLNILVTQETIHSGYGENTLVWVPEGFDARFIAPKVAPSADLTYAITIHNVVIGGVAQEFSYEVVAFDPAPSVFVLTDPPGREVIVDGQTTACPRVYRWSPGSLHSLDVPDPQGGGSKRWVFSTWSQGGPKSQTVTAASSDGALTVAFHEQYYLSRVIVPAGSGTIQVQPQTGDGYYAANSAVSLTAVPASGYVFTGFSGDLTGAANPQAVL